jgi:hypothetical protein
LIQRGSGEHLPPIIQVVQRRHVLVRSHEEHVNTLVPPKPSVTPKPGDHVHVIAQPEDRGFIY